MSLQVSYKKQFVFLFLLTLTFLIVVEVVANVWLYHIYRCDFEDNELFENRNPEINRKMCLESLGIDTSNDNTLTWVPGTRGAEVFGGIDESIVYLNSEGFRGPEFSKSKPENTFRIFTVGGSTTFGSGVFDDQTWSYYLQEMYDQIELEVEVEIINVGWPWAWSLGETEKIKKRWIHYEPDLFIVYDGLNDRGEQLVRRSLDASPIKWKERWTEICDMGNQNGFEVIITLQPNVNSGKKVLTDQELKHSRKNYNIADYTAVYLSYAEKLFELKDHCTIADLRDLFDEVEGPIFFDPAHTGKRGHYITAEKMFELSFPFVTQTNNFSSEVENQFVVDDQPLPKPGFSDNFISASKEIIAKYQTPRVISLIFP